MLPLILACLLGLRLAHGDVIALPARLQRGTELLDLAHVNVTVIGDDTIDKKFKTTVHIYPGVKISGKSTYMNILQAMIHLSYSESEHEYAGETFSFRDYTNVKIQISKAPSLSSTFQYRYAVWGLYKAALYLTTNQFHSIVMNLNWIEGGAATLLGQISIFPDPLPDIFGSKKVPDLMRIGQEEERPPDTLDLANRTSIGSNGTDLAVSTTARKFSVFAELQGQTLSISAVFMAIFLGLVHIASFGTMNIVQDFAMRSIYTDLERTELVYENYGAPRTSPPYFTYHAAARALGYIPKYMFAQNKFEEIVWVLEEGGIPVGQGFLRKSSRASSTT